MTKGYAALALVLALLGAFYYGYSSGASAERTEWEAKVSKAELAAAKAARDTERQQQQEINSALQEQLDTQLAINSRLATDLDELRKRPERPDVPRAEAADCPPATGAELSRPDAEFLTRLAAQADQQRAALAACYAYADSVAGTISGP